MLINIGTELMSQKGNNYIIRRFIGSGAQGEIYEVFDGFTIQALKLYYSHTATQDQKSILEGLVNVTAPSEDFLWPKDLIDIPERRSFGYIMSLIPPGYKEGTALLTRKIEPTFLNLCKACFDFTKNYRALHQAGYQYCDISYTNLFLNSENGKVLICDNDNVVPNGHYSGVLGTNGFMAPEIIRGEASPSRNTDLFSLAVMLFYMLMLNHPLEGQKEAEIHCMDWSARRRLYGTNPIFIWDPNNLENRPVTGYQDNAIAYWRVYPQYIRELFIEAFTTGLHYPNRRITESQWLDALSKLIGHIFTCQNCGAENFYDPNDNSVRSCWKCHNRLVIPYKLVMKRMGDNSTTTLLIKDGTEIFSHYLYDDFDVHTVIARVVRNPRNNAILGLRNLDTRQWILKTTRGVDAIINNGQSARVTANVEIDFNGKLKGHFEN